MLLNLGNMRITSDSMQFFVQEGRVVKAGMVAGKQVKLENVGKEIWETIACCPSFNYALKVIEKRVLLDNDDLKIIQQKLIELEAKIDEFTDILTIGVDGDDIE